MLWIFFAAPKSFSKDKTRSASFRVKTKSYVKFNFNNLEICVFSFTVFLCIVFYWVHLIAVASVFYFFSFVLKFSCVLFWSSHMYCYWNKPNESQMYNNFYKEWFKIMSFKPSNFLDMMIFIEVNDYCRYFVVSWYVVITGKLYWLHCFDCSTISKTLQWTILILMLALHCKSYNPDLCNRDEYKHIL